MPISDAMIKAANDAAAKAWHTGENMTIAMLTAAFGASLSEAERHERAVPDGWQLVPKAMDVGMIGAWYRYKNGWHSHDEPAPRDTSDVGAWAALLAAAPPPPAAVQEPVAVKALEWRELLNRSDRYDQWNAHTIVGRYNITDVKGEFEWYLEGYGPVKHVLSLMDAKAAAQADYEQRIRSALVSVPVAVKAFSSNKEMLEHFGAFDVREGSRMVFNADGSDTWEDYYEASFHALDRIRSALSTSQSDGGRVDG